MCDGFHEDGAPTRRRAASLAAAGRAGQDGHCNGLPAMASSSTRPQRRPHQPPVQAVRATGLALACTALLLSGCQQRPSEESQRIDQLELKIQQLEKRLNQAASRQPDPADRAGKPPAGAIKSLTYRSGCADDRLRIYWADGTTTDLPCTQEQSTLVCG